jgi:tRNA(adenine34) deaminase
MNAPPLSPLFAQAMRVALNEAAAAGHAGEVPVGAVIVKGSEIIVRCQNRMMRDGDATSHAEVLALREATRVTGHARLEGCTLVVTLEPCAMCAGAIVLARPDALIFGAWDDKAGMCGSIGDIVRHAKLNHRPEVRGGVMAEDSTNLLRQFFSERRG